MKKELVFLSSIMDDIRYYQRHSYLGDKLKELLKELTLCSDFKTEQCLADWLIETNQVKQLGELVFFGTHVEFANGTGDGIVTMHLPKLKNDFIPVLSSEADSIIQVSSDGSVPGVMYLSYDNQTLEFMKFVD